MDRFPVSASDLAQASWRRYPGFTKPAKIRLTLPAECNGPLWFWRTSIDSAAGTDSAISTMTT